MENDRLTLKLLLSILSRYTKTSFYIFISCILIAILLFLSTPNTYEARTLIQVETSQQGSATGFEGILSLDGNESDLDQQEKIYKSRTVLGEVIKNLELEIDIEKLQRKIDRISTSSRRIYQAQKGGLLEFSITDNDKELAKRILNETNSIYMKQNIDKYALEARNSIAFLDTSIEKIKKELALSSEKLNKFKEESIPYDISLETENKLSKLIKIEDELSKINIREKEISQTYKKNHPIYLTLIEQKELLNSDKEQLDSEISNLPSTELAYIGLARDVEVGQSTLETMLNRRLELSVIEASTTGNIRVIDKAYLLKNPVSPNIITLLGFGIIIWFIISSVHIFRKEYFLKKILSPSDLEKYGKNIFGVIPFSDEINDTSTKESFSTLLTNITISNFKNKILLVTGPSQGVGKSYISFNLAKKFEELGKKVLLMDLDLRRGSQASNFKTKNDKGITDRINLEPLSVSKNIDLISRSRNIKNIFSILNSEILRSFIKEQSKVYDHIIIDTAPVLPVSDTKLILDIPDQILLVVRQNQSSQQELKFTFENLEYFDSKISGIVLNDFQSNKSYYGYDYYSYRYNSNYKDSYEEN
ncbi:MAG: hypothetical protein CMM96_00770 [Rickettsiales bacterium]|nr:hypothetical protein [Rickettsiales bacterium]